MPGFALLGFSALIFLSLLSASTLITHVCVSQCFPSKRSLLLSYPSLFCSINDKGKSHFTGQLTCLHLVNPKLGCQNSAHSSDFGTAAAQGFLIPDMCNLVLFPIPGCAFLQITWIISTMPSLFFF